MFLVYLCCQYQYNRINGKSTLHASKYRGRIKLATTHLQYGTGEMASDFGYAVALVGYSSL